MSTANELYALLTDAFDRRLFCASLRALADSENPARLNAFAHLFRELTTKVLDDRAPDDEVRKCAWFKKVPNTSRPTRHQRASYLIHAGLMPNYVMEALGLDIKDDLAWLIKAMDQLSKYVHVREKTFDVPAAERDHLAEEALSALVTVLKLSEDGRASLIENLHNRIGTELFREVLDNVIDEVDILATHHAFEDLHIEEAVLETLNASSVEFMVLGRIEFQLQWGSNSDLRRGEGATGYESFPLKCRFVCSTEDPERCSLVDGTLKVDTRDWYGSDEAAELTQTAPSIDDEADAESPY